MKKNQVKDSDIQLTQQSQHVNKQIHITGLVIGLATAAIALVLVIGVGLKIYGVYLDFIGGSVGYDTMSAINIIVSWFLLMIVTILTSVIFFGLFRASSPFSEGNISRIKVIAVILMLLSIAPITIEIFVGMFFGLEIGFTVNLMYIFIGSIFYCLSFIFKHGEIIQKKTDQTINVQEQVILAFAEITEAKSGQTGQHVKRVSEYCRILAENMGMSHDEVENLRLASMMHDIGKLLIPNEILEKESTLTDEEFAIMKTHVIAGEQLLHNAKGEIMSEARTVALEHHEQWDGSGYLGKKGEEISLPARIVAVADVFDALVSARSYKTGWEPNKVYSMIVDESGKKFDPEIVRVFIKSYNKMLEVYKKFSRTDSNGVSESRANFAGYNNYVYNGIKPSAPKVEPRKSPEPHQDVELDLRRLI